MNFFRYSLIILGLFARDSLGDSLANILLFVGVAMILLAKGTENAVAPENQPEPSKPIPPRPKGVTSRPKPTYTPPKNTTNINPHTHLAGFPHRFGKNTKPSSILKPGVQLYPKREPTNPHDKNAIRLYDDAKRFVGFVAKDDNFEYANLMDSGINLHVRVVRVNNSDPWRGILLEIKRQAI